MLQLQQQQQEEGQGQVQLEQAQLVQMVPPPLQQPLPRLGPRLKWQVPTLVWR